MQGYTAAILEDDAAAADSLMWKLKACSACGQLPVVHVATVAALEDYLQNNPALDLLFADIDLEGDKTKGLDAVKRLFPRGSHTQVIYVTGHSDLCTKVYQTEHVYFLLKPVAVADLQDAVALAFSNLEKQVSQQLKVKVGNGIASIAFDDINYIESKGRKLVYSTEKGMIEAYGALSALEKALPPNFQRCHRSYFVNMDKIMRVVSEDWSFAEFPDGSKVPIGQRRYTEFKRLFAQYLSKGI